MNRYLIQFAISFVLAGGVATTASRASADDQVAAPSTVVFEGISAHTSKMSCLYGNQLSFWKDVETGVYSVQVTPMLSGECVGIQAEALRVFEVTRTEDACGSVYYHGVRADEGAEAARIQVIDHRGRFCRDLVDAKVMAEMASAQAAVKNFYSEDYFQKSKRNKLFPKSLF